MKHIKLLNLIPFVRTIRSLIILTSTLFPLLAESSEPVKLSQDTYKPNLGVVIMEVSWGRSWNCGPYQNAQIESTTFTKSQSETSNTINLNLDTPSKLFVDNKYTQYSFVLEPGEYGLTAFDVKIARSATSIAHIKLSKDNLIKDGKF
jgi:hypothetical protein